jgi:hypothetical protein
MSAFDETPPIRPRTLSARIEEEGDTLTLNVREGFRGPEVFLLLWLSAWTVGCAWLLRVVITQREPFMILFAVPFWVSWLFVAAKLMDSLFGHHRFILDSEGLAHEWRALLLRSRRRIPLSDIRRFQVRLFSVDSETGSRTTGIEVVTMGRSQTLGTRLPDLERDWLAYRLDEHLRHLQWRAGVTNSDDIDLIDCRGCGMPSDCSWSVGEEFMALEFRQHGRFNPAGVLGLAFLGLFWNGIVGVFVGILFGWKPGQPMLQGFEWWGLFFFLLPFEAIGLALIGGLLLEMLEPFRRTRWIIAPTTIEQVTTRLGLPLWRRGRYPFDRLAEATIRDDLGSSNTKPTYPTGEQYGLLLSDTDRREICSISGLTLGEARWMKGRLQEYGYVRQE